MKMAINAKFLYFQLKTIFLYSDSFKRNEKEHLQFYWLFIDDSQFENAIEKAFKPIKPNKSLDFLF